MTIKSIKTLGIAAAAAFSVTFAGASPLPPGSSPYSSPDGPQETNTPTSQDSTQRSSKNLNDRLSGRSGVGAGGGWSNAKAPVESSGGVIHTPYFEYNYIDIGTDAGGPGFLAGHQHVYALGYELAWDSGAMLGLNYEYGDRVLNGGNSLESHTVAAYGSVPIYENIFGMLVGGYSDGAQAGPALANASGEQLFINPGIGTSVVLGDVVVTGTLSYLYADHSSAALGDTTTGTIVAELSGRYNVTDAVYVNSGIQYNSITDHDFAAALIDEQWWRASADVGVQLANGLDIYGGYAYDFAHSLYDTHTVRFGVIYEY